MQRSLNNRINWFIEHLKAPSGSVAKKVAEAQLNFYKDEMAQQYASGQRLFASLYDAELAYTLALEDFSAALALENNAASRPSPAKVIAGLKMDLFCYEVDTFWKLKTRTGTNTSTSTRTSPFVDETGGWKRTSSGAWEHRPRTSSKYQW